MSLKIVVTGATGFVGSQLCLELVRRGHALRVVARDPQAARQQLPLPATFYRWDKKGFPVAAVEGADVVIHLAGENIAAGRWSDERKAAIMNSRVETTTQLVAAIDLCEKKPSALVSASAVGFYGDRGSEVLTEASSYGQGFLTDVCRAWEAASESFKGRRVLLRTGVVLGHGGALDKMLPPFRMGVGGKLASGDQWMSWIHLQDLVGLYVHAAETDSLSGAYNAVAPGAVTNTEFTRVMGKVLRRPVLFPVPRPVLKLIFGEMSHVLLDSQNVRPERTLASGYQFKYPQLEQALRDLLVPDGHQGAYVKEAFQWIPKPLDEVFPFFSEAANLERITPEWLNFHIQKMSTPGIQQGTLIDYKLKIKGVPMKWRTRITDWSPPRQFVDEQLSGPYSLWHHTHRFQSLGAGTLMTDRIIYRPPFGPLGTIAREVMVKKDVDKIFGHRLHAVRAQFG